jgi:uracil phosphoribosyltransferase
MLATGGSAIAAIDVLVDAGVPPERIVFVNLVCCPEGTHMRTCTYDFNLQVRTCSDERMPV